MKFGDEGLRHRAGGSVIGCRLLIVIFAIYFVGSLGPLFLHLSEIELVGL